MPNTVAQHAVATFTSPVNGTTPIDANTVRGNDNTTRTSYNNHDADPGIHLQSSTLASRPVAGTAGRKWMTADAGSIRIWHDNGTAWEEASYLSGGGGTISGSLLITGTLGVTGLITATGGVSGNVTGNLTGNASTATALATARNINGVSFNGTADITVTAAAGTLTGSTLASGVTASSLTSVGTLTALTVSGNLTVDTNTLFVDAVNNAVGIGTTTPLSSYLGKLAVEGNISAAFGGKLYQFDATNSSGRYMQALNNSELSIGKYQAGGDVEQVRLYSNGNLTVDTNTLFVDAALNSVGIGTTTLKAYSGFNSLTIGNSSNNGGVLAFRSSYNSGDGAEIYQNASGTLFFNINSGLTAATIDASGNLGLGVTPSAWASTSKVFQLGTIGFFENNNDTSQYIGRNGYRAAGGWTYSTTSPAQLYGMEADGAFKWYTAPSGTAGNAISFTQAMTLDASGNLLVGDPSVTGAVISAYSAANGIIRIRGGSGTNQGGAFFVANSAGSQTLAAFGDSARMLGGSVDASVTVFAGNVPLTFYVNSVERGRYKTTGQLRFVPLSADPGGAETGDVYYNSSTNKLRVYNGAWVDLH